jgi:hypothetical protein
VDASYRGNYGHSTLDQIRRKGWQSTVLKVRPAKLDRDVLALDIPGLFQPLAEGGGDILSLTNRSGTEVPDHGEGARLRADRRWAGSNSPTQKSNEVASVH